MDLVGVAEIAELLGVSRQRVHEIRHTHAEFPEPVASLRCGLIWCRPDIETWARAAGRLPPGTYT